MIQIKYEILVRIYFSVGMFILSLSVNCDRDRIVDLVAKKFPVDVVPTGDQCTYREIVPPTGIFSFPVDYVLSVYRRGN